MPKRADLSEVRRKLADHLTMLIHAKKSRKPRETVHRGRMEYKPKKPISVLHGPLQEG